MSNLSEPILIMFIIIAIILFVSWVIMPLKVLAIDDKLKENNEHLEDLKKIQFEQLQELKKMNGNG